jgi:hypothetical protein
MKELRKKDNSGFLGPNYWFVTADRTLYCADKEIEEDKYPYSVTLDVWFKTISLFIPLATFNQEKKTLEEIFMNFMALDFIAPSPQIDTDALIRIIDWIDFDLYTSKEIMEITSKKFIKDYVKDVQEAREQGKEPRNNIKKVGVIIKEATKPLKEKMEKQARKVKELTGEVEGLKETMKQRNDDIEERDKIVKKGKVYLLATILSLLIILDSFLYVTFENLIVLEIAIGSEIAILIGFPAIRSWLKSAS